MTETSSEHEWCCDEHQQDHEDMQTGRALREAEAICFERGYRLMVWRSLTSFAPPKWVARAKRWDKGSLFRDMGYHYGGTAREAISALIAYMNDMENTNG